MLLIKLSLLLMGADHFCRLLSMRSINFEIT